MADQPPQKILMPPMKPIKAADGQGNIRLKLRTIERVKNLHNCYDNTI